MTAAENTKKPTETDLVPAGCRAASQGDVKQLRALVNRGLDVNKGNVDQRTALHLAASEGRLPVVELLIERFSADATVTDRFGGTPLDDAIRCEHKDVAEYLTQKGAPIGRMTAFTDDAVLLCDAGSQGDAARLTGLVKRRADINQGDYDKRTALHLAASEGKLTCVKVMIEKLGADQNVKDRWGGTPMDDAIRGGHDKVYRFLEKRGALRGKTAAINQGGTTNLCTAAASGDLAALRKQVGEGVDVNTGDDDLRTPMHLAASEGLLLVTKCLVEELHADVNVVDRWGGTPLDDALRSHHTAVVEFLEAHQARRGKTAVYASDGEILCKAGATGDAVSIAGLMHQHVDVNSRNYDQRTALHLAAAEGHLDIVSLLVEGHGADANAADAHGCTPLDGALRAGHDAVAEYLEAHGAARAQAECHDRFAAWGLLDAAARGDSAVLRHLKRRGADTNAVDYDGRAPLHLAASRGHLAAARCLAEELGADLNVLDSSGRTPLDAATRAGHQELAAYLTNRGAFPGSLVAAAAARAAGANPNGNASGPGAVAVAGGKALGAGGLSEHDFGFTVKAWLDRLTCRPQADGKEAFSDDPPSHVLD